MLQSSGTRLRTGMTHACTLEVLPSASLQLHHAGCSCRVGGPARGPERRHKPTLLQAWCSSSPGSGAQHMLQSSRTRLRRGTAHVSTLELLVSASLQLHHAGCSCRVAVRTKDPECRQKPSLPQAWCPGYPGSGVQHNAAVKRDKERHDSCSHSGAVAVCQSAAAPCKLQLQSKRSRAQTHATPPPRLDPPGTAHDITHIWQDACVKQHSALLALGPSGKAQRTACPGHSR